ncbi:MAG: hypothetical protein II117_02935 [Clostridia bacterium]|nr:hypothetical protein [Clostridia bacterium]
MRTITVERQKKFTGAAVKFNVYVEDHEQFDTMIGDVPCRMAGILKNGGSVSFQIDDRETRVFVTQTSLSPNVETIRIPVGQSDLTLTGKLAGMGSGVAFWFDNNDSEEVQERRKTAVKKGKKQLILSILLTAALIVGGVVARLAIKDSVSCAGKSSNQEFTVQEMTIKLNKTFSKESQVGYAAVFRSSDAIVFVTRESKSNLNDGVTLDDIAEYVMEQSEVDDMSGLKHENGMPYVEYTMKDDNSGETLKGYVTFYESDKAFWYLEFMTLQKDYKKMLPSFERWAKSVTFDD